MKIAIINCFDTYDGRVELLYDFFKNKNEVIVIESNFRHFKKEFRNETKKDFIFVNVNSYHKNISFKRIKSHIEFSRKAFSIVKNYKPDLIWVLLPPNSLAKQASIYKKYNKKTKVIFDIIDVWPETMPINILKKTFIGKYWKKIRDDNLFIADHVVTECDLYKNYLKGKITEDKITTVYLARKVKANKLTKKNNSDNIELCYLGSINNIIDIPTIAQIIRKIKGNVTLHIIGDGEKKEELIRASEFAGANVIYHGVVYDEKIKLEIFSRCHFGLNIMKKSVVVGLTMKSIDYFEAGLPIINNIIGDTWDLIAKNDIGINYKSDKEFIKFDSIDINKKAENTRKIFEKNFSVEAFERKIKYILKKIHIEGE